MVRNGAVVCGNVPEDCKHVGTGRVTSTCPQLTCCPTLTDTEPVFMWQYSVERPSEN